MRATQTRLLAWARFTVKVRGVSASTLRTYVYGIASELKARRVELRVDSLCMPLFHAYLDGRAVESPPEAPKFAITDSILDIWLKKLETFKMSRYDKSVWRSFCAVSHNSLRRNAELSRYDIGGVKFGMFSWSSGTYKPRWREGEKWAAMSFNKSKMNTTRRPQIALLPCRCPRVCALHELVYLWRFSGRTQPGDSVFRLEDGTVIDYGRTYRWIKKMAVVTGMDPKRFATQGFRAGGAIDQVDAGIAPRIVMQQAGWKSERSLRRYRSKRTASQLLESAIKGYGLGCSKMNVRPLPGGPRKRRRKNM